jgi:uncharacterized protein (TIGR03435 family)
MRLKRRYAFLCVLPLLLACGSSAIAGPPFPCPGMLPTASRLRSIAKQGPSPTYSLVVAKNGLKLPNTPPRATQLGDSRFATDGFPIVPPEFTGAMTFVVNRQAKLTAQQATMRQMATELEKRLGVRVRDETQLTDKFDFILKFSPEELGGPGGRPFPATTGLDVQEPRGDIFSAPQSEIGLKLEPKRGPVEIVVIDHAEKVPTRN